jgi:hypothetical protein
MKKQTVITLLREIRSEIDREFKRSREESEKYGDDPRSQLAFEVGYLSGTIKGALARLEVLEEQIAKR